MRAFARILFGASALLFAVIALLWHDENTWQNLYRLLQLPLGSVLGTILMIAQIAGAVAIFFPRSAAFGFRVLAIVFGICSAACGLNIVHAPANFWSYGGFFEQFSMFSGAIALFAPVAARIGLGLSAISFTLGQALYLAPTASLVPKWIPPNPMFWAVLTTVAFALAALAILFNVRARIAMRLLGLMTGLFGLLVWVPILVAAPGAHLAWSEFAITMVISGASFVVSVEERGQSREE